MINTDKLKVKEISMEKSRKILGGTWPYWNPLFLAIYIIDEIHDGLTRECDSTCTHG